MNDLDMLLHDAADRHDDGWALPSRDLLAAGRKRVRNHRLALGTAAAAGVAVVAGAFALGTLPGEDRADVGEEPQQNGVYQDVLRVIDPTGVVVADWLVDSAGGL